MKKLNAGFNLIELIIIVVIIGILAAIAIPKFIAQTSNARIAALNGLAGGLNSATALAQAEYVAEGNSSTSSVTSIKMNGTTVVVLAGSGNPAATSAGIGTALQGLSGFTATYTAPMATFRVTGAPSTCMITYNATTGIVSVVPAPSSC